MLDRSQIGLLPLQLIHWCIAEKEKRLRRRRVEKNANEIGMMCFFSVCHPVAWIFQCLVSFSKLWPKKILFVVRLTDIRSKYTYEFLQYV